MFEKIGFSNFESFFRNKIFAKTVKSKVIT